MANPRKFSEKIALHNQKQAEETAAFERIMQEVSVTRVIGVQPQRGQVGSHLNPHTPAYMRSFLGGSLPNVNQITVNPPAELQHHPGFEDPKHAMRHPGRFDSRMRPYNPRRGMIPFERHRAITHFDGTTGQYAPSYLSPPSESSWRSRFALSRTNSDSALHQSVMNPNVQDPFNSANNQIPGAVRRDLIDQHNSPYKTLLENKKLEQQLHGANRPKSCEAPTINVMGEHQTMRQATDTTTLSHSHSHHGNGILPSALTPTLSHVTQIGNNTGSLPDLTNLHIPSPLSNPLDYEELQHHPPHHPSSCQPTMYNPPRTLPSSASVMTSHIGVLSRPPQSPGKPRRHTHNGPSPLSLETSGRVKYPNTVTSPKMNMKSELKSPPHGGSYPYPYPPTPQGTSPHQAGSRTTAPDSRSWHLPSPEHPGSPSHSAQVMTSQQQQHNMQQLSPQGQGVMQLSRGNSSSGGGSQQQQLHVDVSAASKISSSYGAPQQPLVSPHNQKSPHTQSPHHQPKMTSPMTSPTSPTSQCSQASFSPTTSPQHGSEFTTGSNPALSEAYYRSEMTSQALQPLQHQLEQFHVVNDIPPAQQTSLFTSNLAALMEHPSDQPVYDHLTSHGRGGGIATSLSSQVGKQMFHYSPHHNMTSRIPDIVFTGADDGHHHHHHHRGAGGLLGRGSELSADMSAVGDYFPGEELKVNMGLEGMQLLEDTTHIMPDPAVEDSFHLDAL